MLFEGSISALDASIFAALISAAGLLSMALFGDLGRRYSPYISAFAVGVMLTSTLFHLLPEGYFLSPNIWQWITAGFFGFLGFGLLLRIITSGQAFETDLSFAFSSSVALGTHSLLDGVLYATAFQGDGYSGWLSVLGLWVHEFPEGVIIYYLLREARLTTGMAITLAFLTACVSTVLGTVATMHFLQFLTVSLPAMMGITAGAFIYIMIFHLGPHAAKTPNKHGYLAASLGVIMTIAAITINHASFHHHGHNHSSNAPDHDHDQGHEQDHEHEHDEDHSEDRD